MSDKDCGRTISSHHAMSLPCYVSSPKCTIDQDRVTQHLKMASNSSLKTQTDPTRLQHQGVRGVSHGAASEPSCPMARSPYHRHDCHCATPEKAWSSGKVWASQFNGYRFELNKQSRLRQPVASTQSSKIFLAYCVLVSSRSMSECGWSNIRARLEAPRAAIKDSGPVRAGLKQLPYSPLPSGAPSAGPDTGSAQIRPEHKTKRFQTHR